MCAYAAMYGITCPIFQWFRHAANASDREPDMPLRECVGAQIHWETALRAALSNELIPSR